MGELTNLNSPKAITDADIPAEIARDSETAAAVAAHVGASDPHPVYLTQAEGDGRYRQTTVALTDTDIPALIARDTETAAAVAAHVAAADPHPVYLTQAEGDGRYRQSGQPIVAISGGSIISEVNNTNLQAVARDSGSAAYLSLHRPGIYSVQFGLDTDNQLKVGGWSMGNNSYKIWHEGNFQPPQIARAIFTGNCPNTANATTSIPHGLTASRIKAFSAFALVYPGNISEVRIQPGGAVAPWIGSSFYYTVDIGPANISIRTSTNSATIFGTAVTVVVDYV